MKKLEEEKEFWRNNLKKKGFREVTKTLFEEKENTSEESRKIQLKVNKEEIVLYFLK